MSRPKIRVELSVENPIGRDYFYTTLDLPATEQQINDAWQRARLWDNGDLYHDVTILSVPDLPSLEDMRLDATSVDELNFLAKRLDELPDEELVVYQALFQKRFDARWLDTFAASIDVCKLPGRLGASVTEYGVLSARGGSLYDLVSYDAPQEGHDDWYRLFLFVGRLIPCESEVINIKSPVSWVGNKSPILHILYALFPPQYDRYIEPFGGSGSVLLGKPWQDKFEVFNDYNHNLINLFRCMRDRPLAFIRELGFLTLNSRDDFKVLKQFFKKEEFSDEFLKEELELTGILLPEPEAAEIRELCSKVREDYDLRRAAMFLKLIRYSYSSSGKSFACQPFTMRSGFGSCFRISAVSCIICISAIHKALRANATAKPLTSMPQNWLI